MSMRVETIGAIEPQHPVKLELNMTSLVRGTIILELMGTFAHNVWHVKPVGGSPEAMAAYLFWGLVIVIEVNHQLAAGRGKAALDLLNSLVELLIAFLRLLGGLIMSAVWYLTRAAAHVKAYCDKLAAEVEELLGTQCGIANDDVVDVEVRVVPDHTSGTRSRPYKPYRYQRTRRS